ncbi:hypothetical protein AYJ54_37800 [Bradyrhizobium centrolobii]|uniref:Bacteriophage T5 Orf172 DNA-binding domain-containing protein n=2 Tax=Bradyrhizobium centrolobii TaxID=1505087 RepID=A0A176Z7G1_9BRAD|nr:hypothetical protein AYJ54_37800 [Bradyrhizobium centrolobii]
MRDELTADELAFLLRQGLGPDDVLDVRRMTRSYWFQEIKRLNKTIALGSACKKGGHRLRSRKGHCVQCDSSKIAFAGRHDLTQYLYIAGSLRARLIKIGVCKDLRQRIRQICTERHGDARDWEVIYAVEIERAGEIEERVLSRLGHFAIHSHYWKNGSLQQSIELRRCSISQALEAMSAGDRGEGLLSRHQLA